MINIEVVSDNNLWNKKIEKDLFFKKLLKFFPKKYRFIKKKVTLTILLSDNKNIKKLNKKFRNKNKSTDILSFPFNSKIRISKESYIGDIIISYNFINKPRPLSYKIFKERLIKTFIHGFLHLLHYDHIKIKDYKKMIKKELKIYNSVYKKID